jgi:uncharacterized protein
MKYILISLLVFSHSTVLLSQENNPGIHPIIRQWNSFQLSNVQLLPESQFYRAMQTDIKYIKSLDINRLLSHVYQQNGLKSESKNYGGWEAGGRGCTYGHYLSACAMAYASTKDTMLLIRSQKVIDCLYEIQSNTVDGWFLLGREGLLKLQEGELKLNKPDLVGQPWSFNDAGNCWYANHKILAGLLDTYIYTNNKKALEILIRLADWIYNWASHIRNDLFQGMLAVEHGGMNEIFADLFQITGDKKYLDLSIKFSQISVIYPIANGEDILVSRHANAQIPNFIGAARIYELSGNEVMGNAATNFWEMVIRNHTLVIGGNSLHERFGYPGEISKLLGYSSAETCNTYNMLKLTKSLFQLFGQSKYMDYYERALYNQILGSQEPESGCVTYFNSLTPGLFKYYSTPENSFWCCVGTGMENHVKYNESIYFNNNDQLLINLFIPSKLEWTEMGLTLEMLTSFPGSDTITLKIVKNEKYNSDLLFRIPSWLATNPAIMLNNQKVPFDKKDGYIKTNCGKLKEGDELKLILSQCLYLERVKDNPGIVSILYGPLVLAGELGTRGLPNLNIESPHNLDQFPLPTGEVPFFVGSRDNLDEWIKKDPKVPLQFHTSNAGHPFDVSLIPYYKVHHQRFSVYWNFFTQEEYTNREIAMPDEVIIGNSLSEEKHKLKGMNTEIRKINSVWLPNKNSRYATDNGWFSYELNLNKINSNHSLIVEIWEGESDTAFDIFINGKLLTTVINNYPKSFSLRNKTIELPALLCGNKKYIEVRFQAKPGKSTGGIYGINIQGNADL